MRRYPLAVLATVPAALGFGLALLLERDVLPNLLLLGRYQADLAGLAAWAGVLLSLVGWGTLALRWWANRRVVEARAVERNARAAAHRRFLRRLDHELKNPLTIIRAGIANLQYRSGVNSERTDSLARVAEQVTRLQTLVVDLRRLAELEELELEREPVDLQAVLEEALALACDLSAKAQAGTDEQAERDVDVRMQQVPWPVGPVSGDHDLLVLAFRNLLDNALKFTRAGDQVEVRATEDGRWAVVEVADTGPGIPPADLPHIFEELYRGHNAREVAGSGLGLALVQRIVTLHDGEVSVRSRQGQGTVVRVRLPLVSG